MTRREMELTPKQRRRGLDFANKLSMLAADSPDVFTELAVHNLAKTIRKRFAFSKDLRKREILTHLRRCSDNGGMSAAELVDATGYYKNRVYEALDELASEGKAELRMVPPAGDKGGRPSARFFAAGGFSQPET